MKRLVLLFVSVFVLSSVLLIGCGTLSDKSQPSTNKEEQKEEQKTEGAPPKAEEEGEELLSANARRINNVEIKMKALIDTYKDLRINDDGYDVVRMSIMEGEYLASDIVLPTSVGDMRVFGDGSRPTVDWAGNISIIRQFSDRVNYGNSANSDGAEWFTTFANQDEFMSSDIRKLFYNYTDEEIAAGKEEETDKSQVYMLTATTMAATLAQYENSITYGEIFETIEYKMLNGMTSAYAVPILLDGVDYGIIAVFDKDDLLLNIISTDDSQKETWYYYSM